MTGDAVVQPRSKCPDLSAKWKLLSRTHSYGRIPNLRDPRLWLTLQRLREFERAGVCFTMRNSDVESNSAPACVEVRPAAA